jgi:Ca2+-binding EF-hand superfamily protein
MISAVSGASNYDYLSQLRRSGLTSNSSSVDQVFNKIDTNGDGLISKDELAKAQATTHPHHHGRHGHASGATSQTNATSPLDQLFGKIDTNGDGLISKDELTAFQLKSSASATAAQAGSNATVSTSTIAAQQSQTGVVQPLLTQAINAYAQLSRLNPAWAGASSLAVTG